MKIRNILVVLSAGIVLSGCATEQLKPEDFTAPARVEKQVKVVKAADAVTPKAFKYNCDPSILKAYQKFITKGEMKEINTKGFVAYPFDENFQPIIPAQPFQAVDIELEPGENIIPKSIAMGDTQSWTYTIIVSYNNGIPVQHIIFKPKDWNVATNIIVGTNKRTYHFGLVSTKKAKVKQVKFWYPNEMQQKADEYIKSQMDNQGNSFSKDNSDNNSSDIIADVPDLNIKTMSFDYSMSGDDPTWKPIRIFSDNVHTYIQFPKDITNQDMPILYVYKDKEKHMVNYRVKGNYFVIDGVYPQMVLILGRPGYFFNLFDNRQEIVYITNTKLS